MKLSLIRSPVVNACLASPRLGLVLSSWEKQELWKQVHERERERVQTPSLRVREKRLM